MREKGRVVVTSETSGNLPSQHNSPHQAWVCVKIIEDRVRDVEPNMPQARAWEMEVCARVTIQFE